MLSIAKGGVLQNGTETQKKIGNVLFDETVHLISSFELNQMASLSYGELVCDEIFEILQLTLCRPVEHTPLALQKGLVITKHVLVFGSEKCVNSAIVLRDAVAELQEYNTVLMAQRQPGAGSLFLRLKGGGVDKGGPVREAAQDLLPLLLDHEKLRALRNTSADPNSLVPVGGKDVAFLSDEVRHYLLKRRMEEQQRVQVKSNLAKANSAFGSGCNTKDGKSVVGAAHGIEEMMKMAQKTQQKYSDSGPSFKYVAPKVVLASERAASAAAANAAKLNAEKEQDLSEQAAGDFDLLDFGGGDTAAASAQAEPDLLGETDLLGMSSSVSNPQTSDLLGTDHGVGNLLDAPSGFGSDNLLDTNSGYGATNLLDTNSSATGSANFLDMGFSTSSDVMSTKLPHSNPGIGSGTGLDSMDFMGAASSPMTTTGGTGGIGSTNLLDIDSSKSNTGFGSEDLLGVASSSTTKDTGLGSTSFMNSNPPKLGTGLDSTSLMDINPAATVTGPGATDLIDTNSATSGSGTGVTNFLGTDSAVTAISSNYSAPKGNGDAKTKDLLGEFDSNNNKKSVMRNLTTGMSNLFSRVKGEEVQNFSEPTIEVNDTMSQTLASTTTVFSTERKEQNNLDLGSTLTDGLGDLGATNMGQHMSMPGGDNQQALSLGSLTDSPSKKKSIMESNQDRFSALDALDSGDVVKKQAGILTTREAEMRILSLAGNEAAQNINGTSASNALDAMPDHSSSQLSMMSPALSPEKERRGPTLESVTHPADATSSRSLYGNDPTQLESLSSMTAGGLHTDGQKESGIANASTLYGNPSLAIPSLSSNSGIGLTVPLDHVELDEDIGFGMEMGGTMGSGLEPTAEAPAAPPPPPPPPPV